MIFLEIFSKHFTELFKERFHASPHIFLNQATSQLTFTCSKSTTERLEKDVKYVQS